MVKKIIWFIVAGVIVLACMVIWSLSCFILDLRDPNGSFDNKKFNQEVWLQYHDDWEAKNPRGNMIRDIELKYLKQGMIREDVLELLGPPDLQQTDQLLSYNIGMWSGFRMDYDSFDLYFDESGKLQRSVIVQH